MSRPDHAPFPALRFTIRSLVAAACGATLCASFASAQEAPARQDDAEGRILEEVTVTARQVQESLQDVPVAVTALGEEQITQTFGSDLRDLGRYAPNVNVGVVPGFNAAAIAIRGVSTGDKHGIMKTLVAAAKRAGIKAIILVEHDMDLVAEYSSRIVALKGGKVLADNTTSKFLR